MADYFTLKELCASTTATAQGIDNFPSFEVAAHLQDLADNLLDPLRRAWGSAIIVTSGYRCPALNKAVGGVARSVHQQGWAADLKPANGETEDFIDFAKTWVKVYRIKFDQLIRETTPDGKSVWLHFGLYSPTGAQRGQILNLVKQ